MDRRHASGPDVIRAVSTGQFLDLLGIRIDPVRAESASFTINLITPDNGERFVVELSNGTLTNLEGFLAGSTGSMPRSVPWASASSSVGGSAD